MKVLLLFFTLLFANIVFLAILSLVAWCGISLIWPIITYKQVFGAALLGALAFAIASSLITKLLK
jgi:hypothetical protein